MAIKVGINGFGRIGRNIMRAAMGDAEFDFVAVNDLTSAATLAHLLKYDSVHRSISTDVTATENSLSIDGRKVQIFSSPDPAAIPWDELGVEMVVESSGRFTDRAKAAKK